MSNKDYISYIHILDNLLFKVKCLNRFFIGKSDVIDEKWVISLTLLNDPTSKAMESYQQSLTFNDMKLQV